MRAQYRTQAARARRRSCQSFALPSTPSCFRMCATMRRTFDPRFSVAKRRDVAVSSLQRFRAHTVRLDVVFFGSDSNMAVMVLLLPFPTMWNLGYRRCGRSPRRRPCHRYTDTGATNSPTSSLACPRAVHLLATGLPRNAASCSVATNRRPAARCAWRERTSASVFASGWKPLPETTQSTSILRRKSRSDHNFADHFQIVRAAHAQYRRGGKKRTSRNCPSTAVVPDSPW